MRWRFRLHAECHGLRRDHLEPDHPGEHGLSAGLDLERLRARRAKRRPALEAHAFDAPNDGPNGLAISGSRIYGATDTTAFALDAATGRRLWARRLTGRFEQFVGIAPIVDRGRVYVSTQGFPPGGRGVLYALSAATGRIVWRFQTIKEPWLASRVKSGGGGAW